MENTFIKEERIQIGSVPVILYRPREIARNELLPTVIFYHGWGSNKESQKFRGIILASFGFQVILPDSIYHGERNPVEHNKAENMGIYFWKTILSNIEESNALIEIAVEKFQADPNRIGVAGHSMGGYTASGIFSNNKKIKALAVLNGSCSWNYTNEQFAELFQIKESPIEPKEQEKIDKLDPYDRVESFRNRPILILHGQADQVVPVEGQRVFYEKMRENKADSCVKYMEYPRLNHYVTTNMMEEMVNFFGEKL